MGPSGQEGRTVEVFDAVVARRCDVALTFLTSGPNEG